VFYAIRSSSMSTFRRHMPNEDVAIALEDKPKNEDKLPRQKARRGGQQ
jgi:hypothetical protein